jgi:DNA-directed RNA polymerase specialized sigma24 family protein
MGRHLADGPHRHGRGAPGHHRAGAGLSDPVGDVFRAYWWAAVATVTRHVGDLAIAEDAVQDACTAALDQWPRDGVPANPRVWLIGTARHKAIDRLRRDARRTEKEAAAVRDLGPVEGVEPSTADDELALIFTCCHPSLDRSVRIALTLRSVCGLTTARSPPPSSCPCRQWRSASCAARRRSAVPACRSGCRRPTSGPAGSTTCSASSTSSSPRATWRRAGPIWCGARYARRPSSWLAISPTGSRRSPRCSACSPCCCCLTPGARPAPTQRGELVVLEEQDRRL